MHLPIDEHAVAVADVLTRLDFDVQWFGVADWLQLAASVVSVEVDPGRHEGPILCGAAIEFEDAKAELHRRFVHDLAVFSFIWSAVEAAIDEIGPPRVTGTKSGKIRQACAYLQTWFATRGFPAGISEQVHEFERLARECPGFSNVDARLREVNEVGPAGLGLYAVYEFRNQFAHGSLSFPSPDEDNRPISPHSALIQCATRVVLLQLQMLIAAALDGSDQYVYLPDMPSADEDGNVTAVTALLTCHLNETAGIQVEFGS